MWPAASRPVERLTATVSSVVLTWNADRAIRSSSRSRRGHDRGRRREFSPFGPRLLGRDKPNGSFHIVGPPGRVGGLMTGGESRRPTATAAVISRRNVQGQFLLRCRRCLRRLPGRLTLGRLGLDSGNDFHRSTRGSNHIRRKTSDKSFSHFHPRPKLREENCVEGRYSEILSTSICAFDPEMPGERTISRSQLRGHSAIAQFGPESLVHRWVSP